MPRNGRRNLAVGFNWLISYKDLPRSGHRNLAVGFNPRNSQTNDDRRVSDDRAEPRNPHRPLRNRAGPRRFVYVTSPPIRPSKCYDPNRQAFIHQGLSGGSRPRNPNRSNRTNTRSRSPRHVIRPLSQTASRNDGPCGGAGHGDRDRERR